MDEEQADRIEVSRFGSAKGSYFDRGLIGIGVIDKVRPETKQFAN